MLYFVASPIGNLKDLSLRALEVLNDVDLIACEDTRHTGGLLKHYEIKKELISYHQHNEAKRCEELIAMLKEGKKIALVSDAGTPGISDPGYKLLKACQQEGCEYSSIPGPCAFVNALTLSGFPMRPLYFEGFLDAKSAARKRRLSELSEIDATLIFYEAPHRIEKILNEINEIYPESPVALVKEMTKIHEKVHLGKASELLGRLSQISLKGEWVVLIDRLSPELKKKFRY